MQTLPEKKTPLSASPPVHEENIMVDIDGLNISARVSGKGPPLVFYHGWIGNETTFEMCHKDFARHFTVYRPAWPGYGDSVQKTGFSIEDFVEIGRKFIQKLGLKDITLIGNCLGGNVAMEVARTYPELVSRLILIEVHAYFPRYLFPLLVPKVNKLIYRMVFKSTTGFKILNSIMPLQQSDGNNGWLYTWEGFERTDIKSALSFLRAIRQFSKEHGQNEYVKGYRTDVPILYVEGGKTFGPVAEFGNVINKDEMNIEVISIPESYHNPVVEKPELFSKRVLINLGLEK